MKVLAFDIATTTGWAFKHRKKEEQPDYGSFKLSSWNGYYQKVKDLIDLYKPEAIICAEATRFHNAKKRMNMLTGIVALAADRKGLKLYEKKRKKGKGKGYPIDSEMKKAVFGRGVVDKKEICERYNVHDEDAADAMMFCEFYYLTHTD